MVPAAMLGRLGERGGEWGRAGSGAGRFDLGLDEHLLDASLADLVEDVDGLAEHRVFITVDENFGIGLRVLEMKLLNADQELVQGDRFLVPGDGAFQRDRDGDTAGRVARFAGFRGGRATGTPCDLFSESVNSTKVASRKKMTSIRGMISMRARFLPLASLPPDDPAMVVVG